MTMNSSARTHCERSNAGTRIPWILGYFPMANHVQYSKDQSHYDTPNELIAYNTLKDQSSTILSKNHSRLLLPITNPNDRYSQ